MERILSPTFCSSTVSPNSKFLTHSLSSFLIAEKFLLGWVTTIRIANGAVTDAKIANGAVGTNHIAAGAIVTSHLNDGLITNSKIADNSVTSSKIADGSVGTSELIDASVTPVKLHATTLALLGGNEVKDSFSVDFRNASSALSTKTYSSLMYAFTNNVAKVRPYVKFAFFAMRDSGGSDTIQVELQRSTSPSFTSPSVIARRYFRLDGDTWTYCPIEKIDTGAATGNNYYRLVCTSTEGTANFYSNSFESLAFSVLYF